MAGTMLQLRTNLFTILSEITRFQDKHATPRYTFDGYPAFFIAPSGNEADFLTTNDNQRIYAFKVWVFQEYDTTPAANAYDELMECVEEVLNKVDHEENPEDATRTMATSLGAGVTLLAVLATPGRFALDEEKKLLGVEITVRCKTTVDLTLLT